jgi:hypothetical protein
MSFVSFSLRHRARQQFANVNNMSQTLNYFDRPSGVVNVKKATNQPS